MIKLYMEDCLDVLKDLPSSSVDMLLIDPPYGIDFQSRHIKDATKRFAKILNDKKPFTSFIGELPRIMKDSGCLCIFTRWDVQQVFIDELQAKGFKVKNILIWDKMHHGMGDLKRAFASRYESIIFCAMPNFRFEGKRPTDILPFKRVAASKLLHPNEKPVELLEYLINNCTPRSGLVLDCCMGSGSTGVACKNTNRDFIGIELDKKYFEIAKERIESA